MLARLQVFPVVFFSLLVLGTIVALVTRVSPTELIAGAAQAETWFALKMSLLVSVLAVLCSAALGIPAAYYLSRRNFWGKGLLDTLLDIPLIMPPLVAGVGLLFLLGNRMLGSWLTAVGLPFVFSPRGAVLAQFFIAAPIVLRTAKAAFESVDRGYEAAAATLGLSPFKNFIKINLPLAGRSIISGLILAWARALGEFGATLMVAGATRLKTETLPMAVYLNLSSGELEIAVSCALVLLAAAFILLLSMRLIHRGEIIRVSGEGPS